ncbi:MULTISPECIES: hypothetical protein [Sphingomonas]|uniref:hypothetical protein n=1 Tax=Sphingomonas TaxID=13687 RepID=UPI000AEB265D|nr:hypothetical protein [Sphingomonas sp. CCH10-B3]
MTNYRNTSLTSTLTAIALTFVAGSVLMFGALSPAHVQTAQITGQTVATVSAA